MIKNEILKHNHRGRVLTVVSRSDISNRRPSDLSPSLPPLPSASNGMIAGSALTVLNTGQSLVRENEKLRIHLAEAERSISNYRTLLNPNKCNVLKTNMSTQTMASADLPSMQQSFSADDDHEKRAARLEKNNAQLLKKIEDLNKVLEDSNALVSRLSTDNKTLVEQLQKNAEKMNQRNERAAELNRICERKAQVKASAIILGTGVEGLKKDMERLHALAEEEFAHFNSMINASKTAICSIPLKPNVIIPLSEDFATSPIRVSIASAATSPIHWPMVEVVENSIPQQTLLDIAEENVEAGKTESSAASESDTDCTDCDKIENKSFLSAEPRIDKTINQLIERVKELAEDICKAHRLEINAVKHTAHCKDLSRLAAQREITLERDRTHAELKHAREVEDMLKFSLSAIERIVNEIQPSVVQKLREGRAKKMQHIQNSLISRSRELDQRSTEIGAMNSAHLQKFQTKAQNNQKMREDETQDILKQFNFELEQLQSSASRRNDI